MKIAKLLEQDKAQNSKLSLPLNFGDSYLCKKNRIYSKIRSLALKNEFEFTTERNELYEALPLSQLEAILKSKKIPYTDNVSVLVQIDNHIKGGAIWDEVTDNLKKNYLFHESCHAVSRSIGRNFFKTVVSAQEKCLINLLEESFSNTSELLAVCDAADATHRIFFECNSYICMFDDRVNLNSAIQNMGYKLIFQFMFLAYLHSNFLFENLDDKSFQRILNFLDSSKKLDPKNIKSLRALAKIAFKLNPRFRYVTTGFYFRLQGSSEPLASLLDFDFMKMMEEKKDFREFFMELSEVVN